MLPDQKIDLWYVPGWIKQTQQQQSQTIKHPGPSNKSPNAVQNTNCLDRVQHLLPLQDRKKAKAISHHCSNSYPHCRRVSLRSQSAERVWQTQEWGAGKGVCQQAALGHQGGQLLPGRVWHWPTSCLQQGTLASDLRKADCSYTWSSCVIYSVANKLAKTNIFFTSTSFCTLDSACLVFRVNPHNSKWNQLEWCILSFIFYLSVYLSPLLYSKTLNSVLVN